VRPAFHDAIVEALERSDRRAVPETIL